MLLRKNKHRLAKSLKVKFAKNNLTKLLIIEKEEEKQEELWGEQWRQHLGLSSIQLVFLNY